MVTACIGAWSFPLPERWEVRVNDPKKTYVEAPDKTRGIYIQEIVPTPDGTSAMDFATHIQDVNLESYTNLDGAKWNVIARRDGEQAGYFTSVLDIMDRTAQYCIRFIVMCGPNEGLRLALHDYLCEDYAKACAFFDSIETTIARASSVV
jgi:hypothetical protein